MTLIKGKLSEKKHVVKKMMMDVWPLEHQEQEVWDFPGSSVIKTLPSKAGGMGLTLG